MKKLFFIVITLALVSLAACHKVEEEILPSLPELTLAPVSSPAPSPTPVPVVQEHFSLYAQYNKESAPLHLIVQEDHALELASQDVGHLCLMDQGEVLWETTFETDLTTPYQQGHIAVRSTSPLILEVYSQDCFLLFDESLTHVREFSRSELSMAAQAHYDAGADRWIYSHETLSCLMQVHAATGDHSVFYDPGVFYAAYELTAYLPKADLMVVSGYDRRSGKDGYILAEISTRNILGFLSFEDQTYNALHDGENLCFWTVKNNAIHYYRLLVQEMRLEAAMQLSLDSGFYPVQRLSGNTLLIAQAQPDGDYILAAYDMTDGSCLQYAALDSSTFVSASDMYASVVTLPQGTDPRDFWISLNDGNCDLALLKLETTGTPAAHDLAGAAPAPVLLSPVESIHYEEASDRAQSLSELYGVTILIGENAVLYDDTYQVQPLTDPELMSSALDQLESALGHYPYGFFREFTADASMRHFMIAMTGSISRRSADQGIPFVVGYANHTQDRQLICLDSGFNIAGTLYHEVTHAIDERLKSIEDDKGNPLLNETVWSSMNPAGFSYYDAYLNEDGIAWEDLDDGRYTFYVEDNPKDRFFIDRYSKTFAGEDRARIMENACLGEKRIFSESRILHDKLAYYSSLIRQVWDTEGWPDVTAWESMLDEISTSPVG